VGRLELLNLDEMAARQEEEEENDNDEILKEEDLEVPEGNQLIIDSSFHQPLLRILEESNEEIIHHYNEYNAIEVNPEVITDGVQTIPVSQDTLTTKKLKKTKSKKPKKKKKTLDFFGTEGDDDITDENQTQITSVNHYQNVDPAVNVFDSDVGFALGALFDDNDYLVMNTQQQQPSSSSSDGLNQEEVNISNHERDSSIPLNAADTTTDTTTTTALAALRASTPPPIETANDLFSSLFGLQPISNTTDTITVSNNTTTATSTQQSITGSLVFLPPNNLFSKTWSYFDHLEEDIELQQQDPILAQVEKNRTLPQQQNLLPSKPAYLTYLESILPVSLQPVENLTPEQQRKLQEENERLNRLLGLSTSSSQQQQQQSSQDINHLSNNQNYTSFLHMEYQEFIQYTSVQSSQLSTTVKEICTSSYSTWQTLRQQCHSLVSTPMSTATIGSRSQAPSKLQIILLILHSISKLFYHFLLIIVFTLWYLLKLCGVFIWQLCRILFMTLAHWSSHFSQSSMITSYLTSSSGNSSATSNGLVTNSNPMVSSSAMSIQEQITYYRQQFRSFASQYLTLNHGICKHYYYYYSLFYCIYTL
jgi:hypothetical protein